MAELEENDTGSKTGNKPELGHEIELFFDGGFHYELSHEKMGDIFFNPDFFNPNFLIRIFFDTNIFKSWFLIRFLLTRILKRNFFNPDFFNPENSTPIF